MTKNSIIYIIIATVVILALAISVSVYTWPVKVEATYNGIMCRTGVSMPSYSENMTITINGHYTKRLFDNNVYRGQFKIEGLHLADNVDSSNVELLFNKQGRGSLVYVVFKNDGFESIDIGTIYTNNKWTEIFISIPDILSASATGNHRTWSSQDGKVIAMPSNNREEAIEIVNNILQVYWDNKAGQVQ